jgi:hypothetical protein
VTVVLAVLVLLAAATVLVVAAARRHLFDAGPASVGSDWPPPEDEDDFERGDDWGSGGVREPRRPLPSGGSAAVALPEPDDRAA